MCPIGLLGKRGQTPFIYPTRYTIGANGLISANRDEEYSYYHTNDLGTVTALTDEDQLTIVKYTYDAFGNVLSQEGESENSYKFTGKELDADTGLYYYGARYYDASIGRFITKDPFKGYDRFPASLHPYIYCYNNPVNLIDPDGMDPKKDPKDMTDEEIQKEIKEILKKGDFTKEQLKRLKGLSGELTDRTLTAIGNRAKELWRWWSDLVTVDLEFAKMPIPRDDFTTGQKVTSAGAGITMMGGLLFISAPNPVTAAIGLGGVFLGGATTLVGAGMTAMGY